MIGSYCLVLSVKRDLNIRVGSLGLLFFPKGLYVYVGSALNGIMQRVNHHLRRAKPLHWHIDYLTINPNVDIVKVFFKESSVSEECFIANKVSSHGFNVPGFGSSDCGCESHLFFVNDYSFLYELMDGVL